MRQKKKQREIWFNSPKHVLHGEILLSITLCDSTCNTWCLARPSMFIDISSWKWKRRSPLQNTLQASVASSAFTLAPCSSLFYVSIQRVSQFLGSKKHSYYEEASEETRASSTLPRAVLSSLGAAFPSGRQGAPASACARTREREPECGATCMSPKRPQGDHVLTFSSYLVFSTVLWNRN